MPKPDERYEVRNPDVERALRTIAVMLDDHLPEGFAFGLFLVPFGANEPAPKGSGAVFWISNAERDGMVDVIASWVAREEAKRGRH